MAISLANVATSDTFQIWLNATNTLATNLSNTVVTANSTLGSTTGNAQVVGNFGATTLYANTALRGGNNTTSGTLSITSNATFSGTANVSGAANFASVVNAASLSVTGTANVSGAATFASSVNAASLGVTGITVLSSSLSAANLTTTTNTVTFGTAVYFAGNGNVGIGTSTPGVKLQVDGAITAGGFGGGTAGEGGQINIANTSGTNLLILDAYLANTGRVYQEGLNNAVIEIGQLSGTSNGTVDIINEPGVRTARFRNDSIIFNTSNVERLRINSGSSMSLPTTTLRIGQNTTDTPGQGAGASTLGSSWEYNAQGSTIHVARSAFACARLAQRTSSDNFIEFFYNNGTTSTAVGTIALNGTTATLYNTTSDYRLKEDLRPVTGAVNTVLSTPVYKFRWKSAPNEQAFGFLAHEAQQAVPNAVTGEKDGEKMQQMDYSMMVPMLWAAVQELAAQVQELKAQISTR